MPRRARWTGIDWIEVMVKKSGEPEVLRCSFCNKAEAEVTRLIAGPAVFICNECVAVCQDILADDGRFGVSPAPKLIYHNQDETIADVVACRLCDLPLAIDEALGVPERGFLCSGCVDAVRAAFEESRQEPGGAADFP